MTTVAATDLATFQATPLAAAIPRERENAPARSNASHCLADQRKDFSRATYRPIRPGSHPPNRGRKECPRLDTGAAHWGKLELMVRRRRGKRVRGHGLASGPARVQTERHSLRPPLEERQPAAIPSENFVSREPGRQHQANGRMDQRDALDTLNLIAETAGQYAGVVPATC